MDFEVGVEAVGFARQQRFDLAALDLRKQRLQCLPALFDRRGVAFGIAELDQRHDVIEFLLDLLVALDRTVQRLALAHYLLRARGIVPQRGIFRLTIEIAEAHFSSVPVKETSAAGSSIP